MSSKEMSEILDIAIDMAKGLFNVGAMDEVTMREVEALCLPVKKSFFTGVPQKNSTVNPGNRGIH